MSIGVTGMPVYERDERFPIRATAIMWKGTDTSEISVDTFTDMRARIEDYMKIGDASGSLVVDEGAELRATVTFATKSDLIGPLAASLISSAPSSSPSSSSSLYTSVPEPHTGPLAPKPIPSTLTLPSKTSVVVMETESA